MKKNVLIIVAHADDEVIGCGGTIARHVAEGDTVSLVIMADGVSSRKTNSLDALKRRKVASKTAHKILGINKVIYIELPDNAMDSLPLLKIVKKIEPIIATFKPNIVYTHHYGDLNIDHRLTHAAVMTACRPLPNSTVKEIYTFEIVSSTEWNSPFNHSFVAQLFVDISNYYQIKTEAISAYQLEMRESPHSRSTEHIAALSCHRGHSIGVRAAEAFMVMRVLR